MALTRIITNCRWLSFIHVYIDKVNLQNTAFYNLKILNNFEMAGNPIYKCKITFPLNYIIQITKTYQSNTSSISFPVLRIALYLK